MRTYKLLCLIYTDDSRRLSQNKLTLNINKWVINHKFFKN